jgi:hypothetical protein
VATKNIQSKVSEHTTGAPLQTDKDVGFRDIVKYSQPPAQEVSDPLHHLYYQRIQQKITESTKFKTYVQTILTAGEKYESEPILS